MKKILFALFIFAGITTYAQSDSNSNPLKKGSWIIEANTGSWSTGSTAFSLTSADGYTIYSVGTEGGYFVADNLAIKVGLGYSGGDIVGTFSYKAGLKYYVIDKIPLGLDYTGISSDGYGTSSWLGIQAGYALFVANNVSIEPTLRYNATFDKNQSDSAFQALIGFVFHF
ncbi:MAG: hypothetical protein VX798_06105 [Bacteroidota bacterium]|uniref:Outer membrane protein beta-barrel domain-containing protein n=1 Tax=Flagellimonas profundi TaxID=2915620 RepID=A0ABS3FH07_9FLAO|nr:hypothetical protein [Allomuricauda profundi]MBO0342453.1 hypothetical protein [Allomuricauda profundi]MEC7770737.1 hypothetical protein [Bacteroidota bacterium]